MMTAGAADKHAGAGANDHSSRPVQNPIQQPAAPVKQLSDHERENTLQSIDRELGHVGSMFALPMQAAKHYCSALFKGASLMVDTVQDLRKHKALDTCSLSAQAKHEDKLDPEETARKHRTLQLLTERERVLMQLIFKLEERDIVDPFSAVCSAQVCSAIRQFVPELGKAWIHVNWETAMRGTAPSSDQVQQFIDTVDRLALFCLLWPSCSEGFEINKALPPLSTQRAKQLIAALVHRLKSFTVDGRRLLSDALVESMCDCAAQAAWSVVNEHLYGRMGDSRSDRRFAEMACRDLYHPNFRMARVLGNSTIYEKGSVDELVNMWKGAFRERGLPEFNHMYNHRLDGEGTNYLVVQQALDTPDGKKRKAILFVLRGSTGTWVISPDWQSNMRAKIVDVPGTPLRGHQGFVDSSQLMLSNIEDQLQKTRVTGDSLPSPPDVSDVISLVEYLEDGDVVEFVGHSRGGAIATILASQLAWVLQHQKTPKQVYILLTTFNAPRSLECESAIWAGNFESGIEHYRNEARRDAVHHFFPTWMGYGDAGDEILWGPYMIDRRNGPLLIPTIGKIIGDHSIFAEPHWTIAVYDDVVKHSPRDAQA